MHFLRVYNNHTLNPWGSKDDADLAREVFREAFGARAGHPSLYGVESAADEIRTAAAFALTTTDRELKNFFVVRILERDLDQLGVLVDDDHPGTTGVVDVDFHHFEVRNLTQPQAVALTVHLRNTASEGQERFRWVAARFQRPHLERFLLLPDEQVIAEAKRRCLFKLGRGAPADRAGTIHTILAELGRNRPAVPRFRIERAAFLNYRDRIQTGRYASPEGDWQDGEEGLLAAYRAAFR
jgi:hypothetical protein